MLSALRSVSCTVSGPSARPRSRRRSELLVDLQRRFDGVAVEVAMSNLSPVSSTRRRTAAILKRDSESGTRLMQTAIFTVEPRL